MGQNGVPIVVAKKMMRHSNVELTSGIYTHIGDDDVARALDKLPKFFPCKASVVPVTKEEPEQEEPKKEWPGIMNIIDQMVRDEYPGILNILDQMPDEYFEVDCKMDCFTPHLDGQTRTYEDGKGCGNSVVKSMPETQKSPVAQGQTGLSILAPPAGFEPATCGLTVDAF